VYFADGAANVYAVDATSGRQIWTRRVDDHESARVTGSPTLHDGRLFVAVAGLGEEAQGGRPQYECCTFRGSVSALDASTGEVAWKTYVLPALQSRGTNAAGVPLWGPAGGGIWAAPSIDVERGAVYVSTGNGYAEPAQPTTNAVIAFDMKTGAIRWSYQATPNDIWAMGCQQKNPDNPNCPEVLGPDMDFSASPVLTASASGRDLLVIPQKSGMVYALDPDAEGALVWEYRAGEGSGLGGVWGAAADGTRAYIAANDFFSPDPGGMNAVDLDTGERVWYTPPPPKLCGEGRGCVAAQGAAVTAIPGAVFSGSHDGGIRAYSAEDGLVIWTYDTNQTFETVNGVEANGGSLDGPGPVVAGGMLFVNSGYGGIVGRPGNVLLAFGVD
jgi:polyvinyl alcohol dehydrogenase (cytochrome)